MACECTGRIRDQRGQVDNFDSGDNRTTNSLGGAVTTSGGFATFDEFEFKSSGPDRSTPRSATSPTASSSAGTRRRLYETTLPAGQRDVSGYRALSLRAGQILDGGVLNRLDTPRTFRVALRSGSGVVANVGFDVTGLQSIPFPYEYNGGKTVLGTIRIPLKSFRTAGGALPLDDIQAVMLEFRESGLIAVDDIQFTK